MFIDALTGGVTPSLSGPVKLANSEVASSVELLQDDGDERKREVEADWFLELRGRVRGGPLVQRRPVIHCGVEKQGKHWRIVAMKPTEFFDAASR